MTATILVVDDEPDLEALVQQKFRRQIRDGEVKFLFARDGAEALDVLGNRGAVDMVVSDINMPRIDGMEVLRRVHERPNPPEVEPVYLGNPKGFLGFTGASQSTDLPVQQCAFHRSKQAWNLLSRPVSVSLPHPSYLADR